MANQNDQDNSQDSDRLNNLKDRLKALQDTEAAQSKKNQNASQDSSNMAVAFRACSELILSIFVCGGVGYAVDWYFHVGPVGMIIGLLIGMGVGFSSAYRISNNLGMYVGYVQEHKKDTAQSRKAQTEKNDQNK